MQTPFPDQVSQKTDGERIAEIHQASLASMRGRTDRLFARLTLVQLGAGVAVALALSLKAWIDASNSAHSHLWAAMVAGGGIAAWPVYLAWQKPGATLTRHIMAGAQMLASALCTYLAAGRIEAHFHVFGSLALLALYRDSRVIVTATIVAIASHFWLFSFFWTLPDGSWPWIGYTGAMLFEDIFLFLLIRRGLVDALTITTQRVALESLQAKLETQVRERTQELANSVSMLNATLESTADGILVVELAGKVICFNKKFAAMWGYPAELLAKGERVTVVAFAASQTKDPAHFAERIESLACPLSGLSDTVELKDGRTFERYIQPQRTGGQCVGIVVNFRDITEQKRTEQALLEKEEFIRNVIDTDPNLIFVKDRAGRFVLVNRATAEFNGCASTELMGKLESEVNANAEQVAAFHRDDLEVMETLQEKFIHEEQLVSLSGQAIWVQTIKRPLLSASGKADHVLGVATNITQRKRAESFLNSVLQHLPITVFIKESKDLRFVMWNKAGEELLGYSNAEMVGRNDRDFFPRDQADQFVAKDRETMSGGKLVELEEEISTRNQGKRILHTRKIPIMDENGRPSYLLGISEDITLRRRAEEQLAIVHKQLMEASRQAGMAEVAAGVLHNVGNVLNSVNVSAGLVIGNLKKSKLANLDRVITLVGEHESDLGGFLTLDPKGRQVPGYLRQLALHLAQEQSTAIAELTLLQKNIDHIKDIVAMQQNYAKVSGVTETVAVSELVEDALRMNASALCQHNLEVVREFEAAPPVAVEKHKVLQILVNLIRNARHACDEAGRPDKRLVIRIANGLDRVGILVIDNGVGIPAENLTRIFSHGFTTRKDGHGFGLHTSALAAKEMGGSLRVESEGPGRGAAFTLELPLRRAGEPDD